ncbi:MAG: Poly(beta-D-mannuronate) epimerase 7, partial [Pseudomonadota bacterium]
MAVILYSTLVNGSSVSFNPLADVLLFDLTTVSAADLVLTPLGPDGVALSVAGRSYTFTGVTLADFNSTNLVLVNGSQLVQAGLGNAYTPSLAGQGGNDLLVGSVADRAPALVTTSSTGVQGDNFSNSAALSADGRYVAFDSFASNLVTSDANGRNDIFVKDRQTGMLTLVSVDAGGHAGNADSYVPTLSADGRVVAYQSFASNLLAGDTNGVSDIFVKNLATGAITRASTGAAGTQANSDSMAPSMSADGNLVAFYSFASNLVVGDNVYKLNLVPSGIVRKGVDCYIGNGVVLDIHHLISEIAELEKGGI